MLILEDKRMKLPAGNKKKKKIPLAAKPAAAAPAGAMAPAVISRPDTSGVTSPAPAGRRRKKQTNKIIF
jgi:hypothetical protein